MELNAFGVHNEALGYGRFFLAMADALTRAGVTIYDRMPGAVPLDADHHRLNAGRREGLAATACWFSYPTHAPGWWDGQYAAVFTMWETNKLPDAMRAVLDNFDLVIVPSEHNVELFSQSHPNVKYVPLGIDPDWWQPTPRTEPERYFRFLTCGGGPRKGAGLVRDAFLKVFPDGSWPKDGPTPTLQIKWPRHDGNLNHPRIEQVPGRLTAGEERNLYAQAHVYVQASRGEGFGLQPLQAITSALPTILTDAHGHRAFAQLGMPLGATLQHHSVADGYFSFGEAGDWWEPDFDALCDWMLFCYEHYDDVKRDAWDAALLAHRRFTWDASAQAFLDCFPPGQLDAPPPGADAVFRPLAQRLFRTRVTSEHILDVAGVTHRFVPGRDYWECADLKRMLYDAEWLDPDCARDLDAGLTEAQVARLASYSSAQDVCPHCRQVLNSGSYRDEMEAV